MQVEDVRSTLKRLGIKPTKERGQSFLVDPLALQQLVQFASLAGGEQILEIGGGLGALTAELLPYGEVTVIEIEPCMCGELRRRFPGISVVEQDVRLVPLSQFGSELLVLGNLPYSFSTEILFHLLEYRQVVKRAVLLLQREFAERLAAPPGVRANGALTLATQLWCEVLLGPVILGSSFFPKVEVESRVVELRFSASPRADVHNATAFRTLTAASFFRKRKKISNSIKASGFFPPTVVDSAFALSGISPEVRAEDLGLEEFASLSNAFEEVLGAGSRITER